MVVRKKKKTVKLRGSRTYGWGAGKKHRGKGHKGGRGQAGVGKRGAQRKTKYLAKGITPLGKRGMTKIRSRKKERVIALKDLNQLLSKWTDKEIDLTALGYDKLLGTGTLTKKINIGVAKVSKKAKEKLEKLGVKLITSESAPDSENG